MKKSYGSSCSYDYECQTKAGLICAATCMYVKLYKFRFLNNFE